LAGLYALVVRLVVDPTGPVRLMLEYYSRNWGEGITPMGLQDKIENTAEVLKGKAKEAAGKVAGDERLVAEGKIDQGMGHLKQAGSKAKDAVKDVLE
jgi:uncharacterized protein YjbJ (UPF0337 family)